MICEGDCSKLPIEVQHELNNFYEYNFKLGVYVCKSCGHRKP